MPDELITTAQAAEILGVTKRRVRQAADRLGGRRTESGRYVYSRRLVEEYRRRHVRGASRRSEADLHGVLLQIAEDVAAIRRLLEERSEG